MTQSDDVLLKVQDLQLYFRKGKNVVKAVDGLTFDVKKGEVFSIVGESGCGKTTTGRILVGLYKPTGGEMFFDGERIGAGTRSRKKNKQIQMIFQDPIASLNPRMTVREIIGEGLKINGEKNKSVLNEKVCAMLEKVGLDKEYADRYPHEFSGGQRQRIGIARALIMQPKLIIADEPVSALDVSVQAQVINLLNDLRREFGLTVLFIAHDLSVVKYFSDRIAVMYQGKIVEQASSDELFKRPLHAYTRSLLSAIPLPDPFSERVRKRLPYEPEREKTDEKPPVFQEIFSQHFVLCGEFEAEKLKKQKRSGAKKEKKASEQKEK